MQYSNVTWDMAGEEPPTVTDDPKDQATFVFDMVLDRFYPEVPKPSDYRKVCMAIGYPWKPVRIELMKFGVVLSSKRKADPEPDPSDVPLALTNTHIEQRAIGTHLNRLIGEMGVLDGTEPEPRDIEVEGGEVPEACLLGIGSLLSYRGYERNGRDVQLPCKVKTCPVCGPKKREHKVTHIMKHFDGGVIHAVIVEDGGDEWEALHKTLERKEANFQRIPLPEGMAIILTDADIGQVIDREDVEMAVELQPCDGRRRMSSSRAWKDDKTNDWKRIGTSKLSPEERTRIYDEEGCNPVAAPPLANYLPAQDVSLPAPDSTEMRKLKKRLNMWSDEDRVELGEDGWPI